MIDIDGLEKWTKYYEKRIQRLKQLEKILSLLNTKGFEKEVKEIQACLRDPKAVEKVEKEINELKKKIKEREEAENYLIDIENLIKNYGKEVKINKEKLLLGKNLFDNRNYQEAKKIFTAIKNEIENSVKYYKEYVAEYQKVKKIYDEIVTATIVPNKINKDLKQVKDIANKKEYNRAIKWIRGLQNFLEDIKSKVKPVISINSSFESLTVNYWKKISFNIKNTGNAHAKNVKLSFSKELEAKGIKPFDLKAGEEEEIEVNVKPLEAGEVPVEIKAEYERWDGKKYETSQIFTISVNEYDFAKTWEEPTKREE
ncbi:MAG TPA: hypothetical protein ENI52_04925, partial [Thermoplasmata archaeon]|nr:hypothetical protein [Thermoplasmata archaeon]